MDISLIKIIIAFISLAFIFLLIHSFKLKNQRDKLIVDNNKLELEIITKNNELLVSKKELEIIKNNTTTIEKINSTLINQSKLEFENLANKIIDTKSKSLSSFTTDSVQKVLVPFKEKIKDFEKLVNSKFTDESKERYVLKNEISTLINLNNKITQETNALTDALKSNSKFQGDWGEFILEKLLQNSGLTEGREYFYNKSLNSEDGSIFRPDIIINLPDNKHVIIDSKVSLTNFEKYNNASEKKEIEKYSTEHLKSIMKHIDDLSSKHYSNLKGLNSPDFVFMFIPIENAYRLFVEQNSNILQQALEKGISIVSPLVLLPSLKTVSFLWKLDSQNKNGLEIAKEGAKLYDKFVSFYSDFEKIGKSLESGSAQFYNALGKLKDGPGNIFKKIDNLKKLGVSPKKEIR